MNRSLHIPKIVSVLGICCCNIACTPSQYPSMRQAEEACIAWVAEGGSYELLYPSGKRILYSILTNGYEKYKLDKKSRHFKERSYLKPKRKCDYEEATNQYLGIEAVGAPQKDTTLTLDYECAFVPDSYADEQCDVDAPGVSWKAVRNFRVQK